MTDKRVLLLTPEYPPSQGGIQQLLYRVASSFNRVRTRVVALGHKDARLETVEVHRMPRLFALHHKSAIVSLNAWSLGQILTFSPDVVISGHIVVSPAALAISSVARVPYIQYVYGTECLRRPHTAAFACRHAAAVIAISTYTRDLVASHVRHPTRLHVIPPGVDIPTEPPSAVAESSTILNVSRLVERYKGHDVLIRALPLVRARVSGARLVVIGNGPMQRTYEAMAACIGVQDAVEFVGPLSNIDRDAWFGRSRVFAMPSRRSPSGAEGFGIVYLEAGAHGLPVVAGNVGGARDAVKDGVTGLLVDPTDHVAVADALTAILIDRTHAEALGRGGLNHAKEFEWGAIAHRVEDVLLAVMGKVSD